MANLFLDTVQVTVLRGGERINVVPERSAAPARHPAAARHRRRRLPRRVKQPAGPGLRGQGAGHLAPVAGLAGLPAGSTRRMQRVLGPEGPVVPTFIAGFTDSRFFRERGIPAYGVSPFKLGPDDSKGIHGTDERIPLAEIDRGVERMRRILPLYAAPRRPVTALVPRG